MRNAPMMMTMGNGILGLLALWLILGGHLQLAMYAIIAGAILDLADGWTARRIGVASGRGATADTVSDLISFGIAPAAMIATVGHGILRWTAAGVFFLGIVFRLLRFRLRSPEAKEFQGMPSPVAALAVVSLVVLSQKWFPDYPVAEIAAPVYALLAVSLIPFPKFGHPAMKMMSRTLWWGLWVFHFVAFIFFPAEAVWSMTIFYLIIGPTLMKRHKVHLAMEAGMEAQG
ncbi:MAG: CDP-alcohol phosphatidyltransferase family protein [bacterium]